MATGVNGAWSAYRQCAATSAFYKSQLDLFTTTSLWLGISGALLGTVAQLLSSNPISSAAKALGIAGSLAIALAGSLLVQGAFRFAMPVVAVLLLVSLIVQFVVDSTSRRHALTIVAAVLTLVLLVAAWPLVGILLSA
jgi:hypothetical protein